MENGPRARNKVPSESPSDSELESALKNADKSQLAMRDQAQIQNGKPAAELKSDSNLPIVRKVKASDSKVTPVATIRPLDITVPGEIDRYTIGRRIGSGTCGVVHHALDNLLGRDVAVKLSPIGEAHISTGKVPGAQRAYQTEIVAAGRLTHANIVTVYDAGQFEDLNYLVMEVVEGESLKEYGKGKTPLPVHEALRVVADCCLALDYSHSQGILHRDIKPANIMLGENGIVKLLDFGIAVALKDGAGLKKQGPTLGTPNYMSPEQILGRELGATSDFYSLATVLFELLTGRQLFKAKKVKDLFRTVVHKPAPRLQEVRPDLPVDLSNVLARALEKKPSARYQSGKDMAQALQPFIDSFGLVSKRPTAQQLLIRKLQRQPFFLPFSDVEIAQFVSRVQLKTFERHHKLVSEGDKDRRLLVVTEGVVRVQKGGQFVRLLAEGECLGETGFINGTVEQHDMIALTPVTALVLSVDALGELPPKVHLHYYRHISDIVVTRTSMASAAQIDFWL